MLSSCVFSEHPERFAVLYRRVFLGYLHGTCTEGHHSPFAAGFFARTFALAAAGLSFHRARAAVRATTLRCSAVILVSRAFAPRLPSATAAGFFLFAISTMLSAQQKNSNYFLTCYALSIIVRTAMRKRAPKPKPETPATVRAEAEEIGRQAFEAAVGPEPEPTPPPWWESPKKGKDSR